VFQSTRLQWLCVPLSDQGAGHGGHGGAGIVARHGALDERAGGGAAAGGGHLTAPTAEAGGQRPSHCLGGQQPAHQSHQPHVQNKQVKNAQRDKKKMKRIALK
jgi:hypothetical protein